jgi:cell division protein FtsA
MSVRGWKNVSGFRVAGVVDLGSSKTICLIGAVGPWAPGNQNVRDRIRIVGVAQRQTLGVTSGVVTDLEKAERTLRETIAEAEAMAGVTLDDVVVSLNGAYLSSQNFVASADIEGGDIDDDDVSRLFSAGRAYAERDGRSLVHLNTHHGYGLDGATGIDDPRGMVGQRLSTNFHAITGTEAPIQNLLMIIERCFLMTRAMLAGPYAGAIAATTEEERRMGVTCLDLGGGKTALSIFSNGELIFTETVPVGGNHITYDIARTLQTNLAEAERIKALYGSVVVAQSDQHEAFNYTPAAADEGETQQMTIAQLSHVIRQSFDQQIAQLKDRIETVGMAPHIGDQIVLTGGASQLVGASEFISRVFGHRARTGKPMSIDGLPPVFRQSAFSNVIGLMVLSADGIEGQSQASGALGTTSSGYLRRVGRWLRHAF